jgi:hypothetical protein
MADKRVCPIGHGEKSDDVCDQCGAKTIVSTIDETLIPRILCPDCGRELEGWENECPRCGKPL